MKRIDLQNLLLKVEQKYKECWELLSSLKGGKPDKRLSSLQPTLCGALFDLSAQYRKIHQERQSLIARKDGLSPDWFANRQRTLSDQQKCLIEASAIGRAMGDAFAWFFYQNDLELLEQHESSPLNQHTPPGFGGIGEKEFVNGVRMYQGYMILYHGITTILRLGDVSLIDLSKPHVIGIGELKTVPLEPGSLKITMILTTKRRIFPVESTIPVSNKSLAPDNFPPAMKARLERQIERIGKAISRQEKQRNREEIRQELKTHVPELQNLIKSARLSRFCYSQLEQGLLCVVFRQQKRSLYAKVFSSQKVDYGEKLNGIEEKVKNLLLDGSLYNSIITGTLLYIRDGTPHFQLGILPVFWWRLDIETIHKIIFQEYFILTIYNPAHLIARLEKEGFEPVFNNDRLSAFRRSSGDKVLGIDGIWYYIGLICQCFFKEEEVVGMILETVRRADQHESKVPARFDIRFNHRLFGF